MKAFFDTVGRFAELSDESKSALAKILVYHEYPKGYLLLRPNAVCNHLYLIESGLTRTFYSKDGKDVTDWLSHEGTFACSIVSYINRQPDRRGIELLEDSALWSLQYYEIEELCKQYHDIERMGRFIVSFGLTQLQKRFDDLHFASALERYNNLMRTAPTLIQRTPLAYIASYLGITQETLSRMRAQK